MYLDKLTQEGEKSPRVRQDAYRPDTHKKYDRNHDAYLQPHKSGRPDLSSVRTSSKPSARVEPKRFHANTVRSQHISSKRKSVLN